MRRRQRELPVDNFPSIGQGGYTPAQTQELDMIMGQPLISPKHA
jgi:hypothetical protein